MNDLGKDRFLSLRKIARHVVGDLELSACGERGGELEIEFRGGVLRKEGLLFLANLFACSYCMYPCSHSS